MKNDPATKTKRLVVVRGKGTRYEQRIETHVVLYWVASLSAWVTIPGPEE